MSIPESERILIETVTEGVKTGILGLQEGTEIYYKQDFVPNIDSTVLRGETAEQKKRDIEKITQPTPSPVPTEPPGLTPKSASTVKQIENLL